MIDIPDAMKDYKEYKGGVDIHENFRLMERIGIRGHKWWWPIFTHLLDNMMANAYQLYCLAAKSTKSKSMCPLEFRLEVSEALLQFSDKSANTVDAAKRSNEI